MGLYATTTTISVRLPGFLIGDTTTADTSATNVFSSYIDKAEAEFNAYAAKRYDLPFSTVPPLARDLSFEMAAYYTIRAYSSRDWNNRNEVMEDFKTSFEKAMMIGDGKLKMTLTDGTIIAPSTNLLQSSRENQDTVFEVDDPINWKADDDRIDALENARE